MNKKGFTLVELLAVIVILAVILVIAVPKITDVISNTKKSSIESTLKMIATTAEKEYAAREMLGTLDQENNPIECSDVVNLSSADYDTCSITFNNGIASVSLVGKGKFAGYTLVGTKDNVTTTIGNYVYSEPILNGAYPKLDEGMIPVTIAPNGDVTSADPSTSWYSYEDKIWANAVLVKKDDGVHAREYYKTHYNVEVDSSDILAYFVWIPRYRYKLFNVVGNATTYTEEGECTANCPQEIEIVFENKDTSRSIGSTNEAYLTHPAFTFDGEPLNGIWVGKFETTGTGATPTILPNVHSLGNQNVSTQFETSQKFKSDYYGLNNESRMMKNNEWSAVAYLSHSIYGINSEVRINNNDLYKTGCGASDPDNLESTSSCQIVYGSNQDLTVKYPQSTTGNISGIFDMSGGAFEYVMGVLEDSNDNNKGRSGASIDYNSGYNGQLGDNTYKTNGIGFPPSEYYKIYKIDRDNNESADWYNNPDYLGEGLGETIIWYDDYSYFVNYFVPWFIRGGSFGDDIWAGLFSYVSYDGSAYDYISFRVVTS